MAEATRVPPRHRLPGPATCLRRPWSGDPVGYEAGSPALVLALGVSRLAGWRGWYRVAIVVRVAIEATMPGHGEADRASLPGCAGQGVPAMRHQAFGRIVNVGSGTTGMVIPGAGAYAASKSAVNMISAVARRELAGTGVTVGVVLPSTTATEFGGGRFKPGQYPRVRSSAGRVSNSAPGADRSLAPPRSASG
jgi:hypothetical protein